ncbi:hypothetical protein C8J57DRAFT_1496483 [Mycena rebaudengoi]|nr:hypothetical protein C8J57DRAFT_1496483 [Mycena rebaudengoi]
MTEIEMSDLSGHRESDESPANAQDTPDPVSAFWAWSTAALLILMSSVLSISPRLLLFLSSEATEDGIERRTTLTSLESFLSLHTSIWLCAVAIGLITNIPSVPPVSRQQQRVTPSHPLLIPLAVAGNLSAFIAYNTKTVGSLATIVFVGSSVIGLCGTWAAVFGTSSSISKKTGADKHTSSFLFGNKSAASVQKKQWLKNRNVTGT